MTLKPIAPDAFSFGDLLLQHDGVYAGGPGQGQQKGNCLFPRSRPQGLPKRRLISSPRAAATWQSGSDNNHPGSQECSATIALRGRRNGSKSREADRGGGHDSHSWNSRTSQAGGSRRRLHWAATPRRRDRHRARSRCRSAPPWCRRRSSMGMEQSRPHCRPSGSSPVGPERPLHRAGIASADRRPA